MKLRATRLTAVSHAVRRMLASVFDGAVVAYALRIPSGSSSNNPLIRVRRSIDNAEADFGAVSVADSNGDRWLDTTALLSFVGAGDGCVTIWYDQGPNARHARQTVAGSQPLIVNSGALNEKNGRPSLRFAAASRFLRWTGTPPPWPQLLNSVVSFDNFAAPPDGRMYSLEYGDRGAGNGVAIGATYNTTNMRQSATVNFQSFNLTTKTLAFDALTVTSWYYQQGVPTTLTAWADGAETFNTSVANNGAPTVGITLGRRAFGDYQLYGNLSESVVLQPLTARRALERSQGAAFGITVA